MGDRFYMQQKKAKPRTRKLKKDIIPPIASLLLVDAEDLAFLNKLTIADIEQLTEYIKDMLNEC